MQRIIAQLHPRCREAEEEEGRLSTLTILAKKQVKSGIDRIRRSLNQREAELCAQVDAAAAKCKTLSPNSLSELQSQAEDLERVLKQLIAQSEVSDFDLQKARIRMTSLLAEYDELGTEENVRLERMDIIFNEVEVLQGIHQCGGLAIEPPEIRELVARSFCEVTFCCLYIPYTCVLV